MMQKPTLVEVFALIAKQEDLLKQATVERSHYYVAATCRETITMLYALARHMYGEPPHAEAGTKERG